MATTPTPPSRAVAVTLRDYTGAPRDTFTFPVRFPMTSLEEVTRTMKARFGAWLLTHGDTIEITIVEER